MKTRSVLFAALGAGVLLTASAPAFADWHGGGHGGGWHGGWHEHEGWRGERWEHRGWGRGYYGYPYAYGPRVYYAPAPYYSYYPYYYPPSVSFGVTIP